MVHLVLPLFFSFIAFSFALSLVEEPFIYKPETPEEIFTRLDRDQDGSLNEEDFFRMDLWYESHVKDTFKKLDADGDGKVTKEEHAAYYAEQERISQEIALNYSISQVEEFDEDGDSLLSPSELQTLIKRYYYQKSKDPKQLVEKFDKNGDGKLSAQEYLDFNRNTPWEDFLPLDEDERQPVKILPVDLYEKPVDDSNMRPAPRTPEISILPAIAVASDSMNETELESMREKFDAFVGDVQNWLVDTRGKVHETASDAADTVRGTFEDLGKTLEDKYQHIAGGIESGWEDVKSSDFVEKAGDTLSNAGQDVGRWAENAWQGVLGWFGPS